MANNRIQVKRTSTAGRTPNTTSSGNSQYINAGEFALNMADGILYSSNGSALIEVGANNTTKYVSTNSMIVGNTLYLVSNGNVGLSVSTPVYKLQVNGSFAATTKSFVIDHPTKPNMKLRYGSLEGPENGVYVRGKLDWHTTIYLPYYWDDLIDSDTITVNLTPVGEAQDGVYVETVDSEYIILNKCFKGFYTVFAERKDVDKLVVEF